MDSHTAGALEGRGGIGRLHLPADWFGLRSEPQLALERGRTRTHDTEPEVHHVTRRVDARERR